MVRLLGLLLLLWIDLWVNGEEELDVFINDIAATFQLSSPTIIFDGEDVPEVCYTSPWLLCLPSNQPEIDLKELPNNPESYRESQNDGMHIIL